MRLLFLCTAHNSLSQRLYLALAESHDVTIEYALSAEVMIEAARLSTPDLIICPFLTARIPPEIYQDYLTLIVHPGPPGDAGPSSLDWVLIGDDGQECDATAQLGRLSKWGPGRRCWGVTVLQAIEEFDSGPVWAFEQFPISIDDSRLTKSSLYRGAVTRAAVTATLAAVDRIQAAASPTIAKGLLRGEADYMRGSLVISPGLSADPSYRELSVTSQTPIECGPTRMRPLLKAAQREFDVIKDTALQICRRIRCGDSQPGCLSNVFGTPLYIYGGILEDGEWVSYRDAIPGTIIGYRDEAVCIATCDRKGVWVTHVRRLKLKGDQTLWPKVPAVTGLSKLGLLSSERIQELTLPRPTSDWSAATNSTYQEIWIDFDTSQDGKTAAYLHFEFYNGAMSTGQCSRLIEAFEYLLAKHDQSPLSAVVLMGGSYFSNGIHLNVIESADDPAYESWLNINRINDVVYYVLYELPRRRILTVAAIRGNCAAGGVALAAACDKVIAGAEVVINPAYRALGLYGSEYHTLSYFQRCGDGAIGLLRDMTPLSATDAQSIGLVDQVLPGYGVELDAHIRNRVEALVISSNLALPNWKQRVTLSLASLAQIREAELAQMAKDFWSPRSIRYHSRRGDFVRKIKPLATPLRFATHRRIQNGRTVYDEEELDEFDDLGFFQERRQQIVQPSVQQHIIESSRTGIPSEKLGLKGLSTGGQSRSLNPTSLFSCYYGSSNALEV